MGNQPSLGKKGKDNCSRQDVIIDMNDIVVGKVLGGGALCKVNKAYWKSGDMQVALKTFYVPDLVPEDLNDFKREVMLTREMNHPNIIHFLAGCAEPPNIYLIMELAKHGTVAGLIGDHFGPFPYALRLRIALDTAKAMEYLHSKNVLHRDLKPDNLLVFSLNPEAPVVVKLADLGIAKLKEPAHSNVMTQGRGTLQYMAPEILNMSKDYSFPVDIYSFGLIMWELITRQQPYADIRPHFKVPIKVLEGERPRIPGSCPKEWGELMKRCWATDPTRRPTFSKIVKALEELSRAKIFHALDKEEASLFGSKVRIDLSELEVGETLGVGALCRVQKAYWKKQDRHVALKTFHCPDLVDEELSDFERELWLTSHMDHPNLIKFLGGRGEPPNVFLVTELVEHGSLWDLLHDKKRLIPWKLRLLMAKDIAEGMNYLHNQNILHRDLKSENLLVCGNIDRFIKKEDAEAEIEKGQPFVKVADLGIARWMRPKADLPMTMGRGTQQWMAPEIMEGSKEYSFPVDVYSYGIILWELLTREEPFEEVTPKFKLPVFVIEGMRPSIPTHCPAAYAQLVCNCWDKDPDRRPSFKQILEALATMIKDDIFADLAAEEDSKQSISKRFPKSYTPSTTSAKDSDKDRLVGLSHNVSAVTRKATKKQGSTKHAQLHSQPNSDKDKEVQPALRLGVLKEESNRGANRKPMNLRLSDKEKEKEREKDKKGGNKLKASTKSLDRYFNIDKERERDKEIKASGEAFSKVVKRSASNNVAKRKSGSQTPSPQQQSAATKGSPITNSSSSSGGEALSHPSAKTVVKSATAKEQEFLLGGVMTFAEGRHNN